MSVNTNPDMNRLDPLVSGVGKAVLQKLKEDVAALRQRITELEATELKLHAKLAESVLQAQLGWGRYESANRLNAAMLAAAPQPQPGAQPVQQEPVGWIDAKALEELEKQEMNWMPIWNRQKGISPIALYTSPQAQQPLTPEWYARWIRNNYQDHPNIATLCEELTKAAHGITKGTT